MPIMTERWLARNGKASQIIIPVFQADFAGIYSSEKEGRDIKYLGLMPPVVSYSRFHCSEIWLQDSPTNSLLSPVKSGISEKYLPHVSRQSLILLIFRYS